MPANLPPPPEYDEEEYVEDPSDLPPPYYEPTVPRPPPEVVKFEEDAKTAAAVSSEVARDALLRYIDQNECCWGTGPAKECSIQTNFWASIVCKMETFVEYRITAFEYRPYEKGSSISKAGKGHTPLPWDMQCPPAVNFKDSVTKYDVPFTSKIKRCDECDGRKRVECRNCDGEGRLRCRPCGGDGKCRVRGDEGKPDREVQCKECNGRGKVDCNFRDCRGKECNGGTLTCPTCTGFGQMEKYLEMSRHLETIVNSRTVDQIPDQELDPSLIAQAPGRVILSASAVNILPPSGFSPEVDSALQDIDRQGMADLASRHGFLHQERLEIKSVPVSKAEATTGDGKFHFWVYGDDNRCVCKEDWGYPAQCCCGCVIC